MDPALLFVDDEIPALVAMGRYFSQLPYRVSCTSTVDDARRLLGFARYDLVITDVRLDGTTCRGGFEVLRHIRETSPGTRVVLHTAVRTADIEQLAWSLGADAILQKPTRLSELAELVRVLLDGHSSRNVQSA
jgi:two-component system response regulator PilR (NtrC family)